MSYWQMDDGFLGHHKTVRAIRKGPEALQMWVALRTYVAKNTTNGTVPDEDIDDLPQAPKNPRKWLQVLVECGKPVGGGIRAPGLVDPICDGQWKLHNYERHGLPADEIQRRKEAARERKKKWHEKRSGTEPERRPERVPNAFPTRQGTTSEMIQGTRSGRGKNAPPFPSPSPTPGEEDLPPPPQRTTTDYFALSLAPLRTDVARLHEAYKRRFGLTGHKLRNAADPNAVDLATAIDQAGLDTCLAVLEVAPEDPMVSGKGDERGQKHEKISYLFGNPDTFARLLRAVEQRKKRANRPGIDQAFDAAMNAEPEA